MKLKKPTVVTWTRVLAGGLLIVLVLLIGEELKPHFHTMEEWIGRQGMMAPVYYILFLTVLSILCFPLDVLFILCGILFGFWPGLLYMSLGILLSQSLIFLLSHTWLKALVLSKLDHYPRARTLHSLVGKANLRLLSLVRMSPVPLSPVTYLLGTTQIKYRHFLLSTLGAIPTSAASLYVGVVAVHATVDTQTSHWHNLPLYGGFLLVVALVAFIGHRARQALRALEVS